MISTTLKGGPGRFAPALIFFAVALCSASGAAAQQGAARQQAAPARAEAILPDQSTMTKLVWTTMAAVDHANVTGNYSVLRELGSPSFQAKNTPASLAGTFESLRAQRLDLGNTLLVVPEYDIPPTLVEGGLLRVRGIFPLRPLSVAFDLLYQPAGGRWALFGIAVGAVAAPPPARR